MTWTTSTAQWRRQVYVNKSVLLAKEETTVGRSLVVAGNGFGVQQRVGVFNDSGGMRWRAAVCGCMALPPCGHKAGIGG